MAVQQRAVAFRFLLGGRDFGLQLLVDLLVFALGPGPKRVMPPQSRGGKTSPSGLPRVNTIYDTAP